MGISKDSIKLIYELAKDPSYFWVMRDDVQEDILTTAAELAQYYEVNERHLHEAEEKAMKRSDT